MENLKVAVEMEFTTSPQKLWKALTDKNEMKLWYFDLEEFEPEVGFEFRFPGGPEHKTYYHICKITDIEINKIIAYDWRYDGYAGNSNVKFEISQSDTSPEKTKLILTHLGLDTFPDDNPDLAAKNFQEGWNYIIGTSLKNYLES